MYSHEYMWISRSTTHRKWVLPYTLQCFFHGMHKNTAEPIPKHGPGETQKKPVQFIKTRTKDIEVKDLKICNSTLNQYSIQRLFSISLPNFSSQYWRLSSLWSIYLYTICSFNHSPNSSGTRGAQLHRVNNMEEEDKTTGCVTFRSFN